MMIEDIATEARRKVVESFGKAANWMSDFTGVRALTDPLPRPDRPGCYFVSIPGYKQVQDYTCGFIAAANVLRAFAPDADLGYLYDYLDYANGTHAPQVMTALRKYGIRVRNRNSLDFQVICAAIQAGSPIICSIQCTHYMHWVVIYGCDRERRTFFFVAMDIFLSSTGKNRISRILKRSGIPSVTE